MELSLIHNKIYEIRGNRVMMDFDLAEMYETETKLLKRAVNRNKERFPSDFMYQLTKKEYESLRCQIGTLEKGQGRGKYSKFLPYAFTEQGVAMLSSALKSERAIKVNIFIMRCFVLIRQQTLSYKELQEKLKTLEKKYNKNFRLVFNAIKLMTEDKETSDQFKNRERIGFKK
jgi:hypothetical protein